MTADEARAFPQGYSVANAARVLAALDCGCKPYEDVFTFARWRALGRTVTKGQHAIRISTYAPVTDKETGEVIGRRPWRSAVFCRHQTAELVTGGQ